MKTKILVIVSGATVVFLLGRATAPKPQTVFKYKYITDTEAVQKAIEEVKKQNSENSKNHRVILKNTVRLPSGEVRRTEKITVDAIKSDVHTQEVHTENETHTKNVENSIYNRVDDSLNFEYTFMIGKPLNSWSSGSNHYDYFTAVEIPVVKNLKLNMGYEWNQKNIFIGTTFQIQ